MTYNLSFKALLRHPAPCTWQPVDSSLKYTSFAINLSILSRLFSLESSPHSGQTISHLGHIIACQKTLLLCTEPSHANDK